MAYPVECYIHPWLRPAKRNGTNSKSLSSVTRSPARLQHCSASTVLKCYAQYTLATKSNSTRSIIDAGNKTERIKLSTVYTDRIQSRKFVNINEMIVVHFLISVSNVRPERCVCSLPTLQWPGWLKMQDLKMEDKLPKAIT